MAGLGLRAPHIGEVIRTRPAVGWFEVHSENYLGGGAPLSRLEAIRRHYPLSLHGVGLSLGSAEGPDPLHLRRLKALIARTEPFLVSDHLSWSISGGVYLNDLLPLPYTEEALGLFGRNLSMAQEALGRRLLIENPSRYLQYRDEPIPEAEFMGELVRRTGCGVLLDVNNIFVTCQNLGLDADAFLDGYFDAVPAAAIGEIHLAGHAEIERNGHKLLIDDHGSRVKEPVWALYRRTIGKLGKTPSLIEWDKDIPAFEILLEEGRRADAAAS